MDYRPYGRTGLTVSAIGLGCVQLSSSRTDIAGQIVKRALELGITYYDVARSYGDSEIKLGLGLASDRASVVVSSKTSARSRDEAWRHINESLERLQTSYIDNYHLHALHSQDDIDRRLAPDGALQALIQAKQQGLIHHIGCSSHRSDVLIKAINRWEFEAILVPMNIVEREPLDVLIPLCHEKGIAVTIMKPVATGLLPAPLALKWLLNQPIASAVPGCTTLAELEENARVGCGDYTLSANETQQITQLRESLEHTRCRICAECMPCPQNIIILFILGSDVMYDHYRTMGPEQFRAFPWSRTQIEQELRHRPEVIASIKSCTRCGVCEERCPHGLPVMDMLHNMIPAMEDMVAAYHDLLNRVSP